jgi:hypothetical protein
MLGAMRPVADGNMVFQLAGSTSVKTFYSVGLVVVKFSAGVASVSFARKGGNEYFQCSDALGIVDLYNYCRTCTALNADCSIVKAGNNATQFCIVSVNSQAFHLLFDRKYQ